MDETLTIAEALARLAAALACGAIVGINRDLHGKHAGVRAFALVALGTAGVTVGSIAATQTDPETVGRVVQGVLTEIGFLGAGVIVRREGRGEVTGPTTAAAVWFTATIAMVCGFGQYALAGWMMAAGLAVLVGGRAVERGMERLVGKAAGESRE